MCPVCLWFPLAPGSLEVDHRVVFSLFAIATHVMAEQVDGMALVAQETPHRKSAHATRWPELLGHGDVRPADMYEAQSILKSSFKTWALSKNIPMKTFRKRVEYWFPELSFFWFFFT